MTLRPHQAEMLDICNEIKNGSEIKDIFCDIAPGGGKTGMALIAFNELVGSVVDTCIVIVPRDSLKLQFEKDCLDEKFYSGKILRAANNGTDMLRGADGYVTTYQAVVSNTKCHVEQLKGKSYMVILDELHHMKDESGFGESCYEIIQNAKVTIQMSGTFETQNGFIKTVPYENGVPSKQNTRTQRWINYSRSQALKDKSILPIDFHLYDCAGTSNGTEFDKIGYSREFLSAAINSEFSKEIIQECLVDFIETKKVFPFAKMIVIDSTINNARKTKEYLDSFKIKNVIATSDDKDCSENIEKFKKDIDVLCSVGVAYEGLDVPQTTHVCLLTHIRSKSWVAQAIGRCQRRYKDKIKGVVFAPKDNLLTTALKDIQKDVINAYKERTQSENKKRKYEREIKENDFFTFIKGKDFMTDCTLSDVEKNYRTLISKLVEGWIYKKSFVRIQGKTERATNMDMKRRKTLYKTIHMKFGVKGIDELNVFQLEQAYDMLCVMLKPPA